MAMPQTLRDARGYRSRYINALNAAIKAIAPIAGRGIRLRQTPQGTVIEATAKSATVEGGEPVADLLPFDLAIQTRTTSSGEEQWWCVYAPEWSVVWPKAGESGEPWDTTTETARLTVPQSEDFPAGWYPLATVSAVNEATDAVAGIEIDLAATGALQQDLPVVLLMDDAAAGHSDTEPQILANGAVWLPFGYLINSTATEKTLANSHRGRLTNGLIPGSATLCHRSLPDGTWEPVQGATLTENEAYALATWWKADFTPWGVSLDLRPLGLANDGLDCVTHLDDHTAGVL